MIDNKETLSFFPQPVFKYKVNILIKLVYNFAILISDILNENINDWCNQINVNLTSHFFITQEIIKKKENERKNFIEGEFEDIDENDDRKV